MQKTSQKEFRVEKVKKRKGDKIKVKWKGYNSSFNSWIDKKDYIWVSICQNWNHQEEECKLNYICLIMQQKADLKNATGCDTSKFAKKVDLANIKSNVHKLYINKLKNVPTNKAIWK